MALLDLQGMETTRGHDGNTSTASLLLCGYSTLSVVTCDT